MQTQEKFEKRLKIFLLNASAPELRVHALSGEWRGYWSINITGDIRAVYQKDGNVVIFIAIGSHSELYM